MCKYDKNSIFINVQSQKLHCIRVSLLLKFSDLDIPDRFLLFGSNIRFSPIESFKVSVLLTFSQI